MDLLHRKAQNYKFSNENDFFCAWWDFNKTFCGISTYHKWMFKLQISSIFHLDWAHQSWISGLLGVKRILDTRIFRAYGPIMFALRVWVGFEASPSVGTEFMFQFQITSNSCSEGHIASYLEGHMASCLEGHFLRIVFRRTHCIMFGRTLFRIWCLKLFKQTLTY